MLYDYQNYKFLYIISELWIYFRLLVCPRGVSKNDAHALTSAVPGYALPWQRLPLSTQPSWPNLSSQCQNQHSTTII